MKINLTVAAYIFNEDKLLLVHHKKLNAWLPLGGHIDDNETPDQAVLREIKEETGLEVSILNQSTLPILGAVKYNLAIPFDANVHSVGDHDHACWFYVCELVSDLDESLNDRELYDMKWFSASAIKTSSAPEDVKVQAAKAFEVYKSLR